MSSSVSLIVTTESVDSKLLGNAGSARESVNNVLNLLQAMLGGNENGKIDATLVQGTAPAAASGTVVLTYASIANNDTVTLGNTVLTCVTAAPSGAQFQKVTDGPTTATNLAALINSNATTSALFSATAVSSTVTITCLQKGVLGNAVGLTTSNGTGFAVTAPSGGAGGPSGAPNTYRLGL